jgi:hypothetical protein
MYLHSLLISGPKLDLFFGGWRLPKPLNQVLTFLNQTRLETLEDGCIHDIPPNRRPFHSLAK